MAGFADDCYAYGVTLWEMLSGRSAHEFLIDELCALEGKSPHQWAEVHDEVERRGWDEDDLDVTVAHAWGFISLEEVTPSIITLLQGL